MDHPLSYAAYAALGSPPAIDACASAPDLAPRPHWRALGPALSAPVSPLAAFQPMSLPYWRGHVLTRVIPQLALTALVLITFLSFLAWRAGRACCCGRARRARWAGLDRAAAAAAVPRCVLASHAHKAAVGLGAVGALLVTVAAAYAMAQAEPRALDKGLAVLEGDVRGLLAEAASMLADIATALGDAADGVDAMATAAAQAGLETSDPAADAVANAAYAQATDLAVSLGRTVAEVDGVVTALNASIVGRLDAAVADHLPLARSIDAGRLAATYGLLGALALCVAVAAVAALGGVPAGIAAGLGLALAIAAVLALVATPLMAGAVAGGADACGWAEPALLAVAGDLDDGSLTPTLAAVLYGPAAGDALRDWPELSEGAGGGTTASAGGGTGPIVASVPALARSLAAWAPPNATAAKAAAAAATSSTTDVLGLGLADLGAAAGSAAADLQAVAVAYESVVGPDPPFTAGTASAAAALTRVSANITALDEILSPSSLRSVYIRVKGLACCIVADGVGDLWFGLALTLGATLLTTIPLAVVLARLDGLPPLVRPRGRRSCCWCGGGWARRRAGEGAEDGAGGAPAGAVGAPSYTAAVASPPPGTPVTVRTPPPATAPLHPEGSGVPLVAGRVAPSAPPLGGGGPPPFAASVLVGPAAWPVRPASHVTPGPTPSTAPPHYAKYPKI